MCCTQYVYLNDIALCIAILEAAGGCFVSGLGVVLCNQILNQQAHVGQSPTQHKQFVAVAITQYICSQHKEIEGSKFLQRGDPNEFFIRISHCVCSDDVIAQPSLR